MWKLQIITLILLFEFEKLQGDIGGSSLNKNQDISEKFKIPEYNNVLVQATADVIVNFYAKVSLSVNIFRESNGSKRHIFDSGFINEVLINVKDNIIIEFEDHNILDSHENLYECDEETEKCYSRHQIRAYNIFFINDYETFQEIFSKMNTEEFSFPGFYLIILTKFKKNFGDDVTQIFSDFWSQNIVNVNILVSPNEYYNEAQLLTYSPYQSYSCGKSRYYLLNIFKEGKFTWDNEYFPSKDANMHACPVKVAVFQTPPFMILNHLDDGSLYTDGIDGTILRVLSQKMNFSLDLIIPAEGKGVIYSNGTSTGVMKSVIEGTSEFTIGYHIRTATANNLMTDSYYYTTSKQIWLVPPGKQKTALEKLLQPFKVKLWSASALVVLLSFLTVFILKFFPKIFKNFVYGRQITYPGLNIINITFGGSMPRTPGRNFARYILNIFVLYCLILRSAYQGAMFNFLTSNTTTAGAQTLDEMIERNFTFYLLESSKFFIDHIPNIAERSVYLPIKKYIPSLQKSNDPDFKGAFLVSEDHLIYINMENFPNVMVNYAKEPLFSVNLCIYLNKKSSLIGQINKHLIALNTHGFIKQWTAYYIQKRFILKQINPAPKELQISQLLGGFQMWCVGLGVSCFFFLLELMSLKFKVLMKLFDFFH